MHTVLTDKDYKIVDKIVLENSDHPQSVLESIHNDILPRLPQRQHFLDIGPGVGVITREIAKRFAKTSIVEPNREMYRIHQHSDYTIHPTTFQEVELPERYDLVLCSHMLYHVPLKDWPLFLDKLVNAVNPGGVALIAMIAPRGYNHEYYLQFVKHYRSSKQVIEHMSKRQVPIEVSQANYRFTTWTFDEMYTLCRFLTLEDLYSPAAHRRMSQTEKEIIDQRIRKYAEERQTPHGNYTLEHEGDYIIYFKPKNSSLKL